MSKQDLLIIVGCEELPARYVQFSANSLQKNLLSLLKRIDHGTSKTYATPRRIAVHINNVSSNVRTDTSIVTGPPADRAFKDGEPTKAAIGFARGKGVDVNELKIIDGPRGPVVAVEVQTGGESVVEILQAGLENAVLKMDFERSMRWGDGKTSWARPINKLIVLHGSTPINCTLGTIKSSQMDTGHRLSPGPFEVQNVDQWIQELEQRYVIADRNKRKTICSNQLEHLSELHGAKIQDWDLLEEVVDLVEFPNTIRCAFPNDLLELPPRLLVEAMKLHQRVFPLYDTADGTLRSDFLTVTNHPFANEPTVSETISEGNKRVLTARFYDAKFFFAEDRKKTLVEHGAKLTNMRWVRNGGSVANKVERLVTTSLSWSKIFGADPQLVQRAATLCKCDLGTQMVYEFTDLQGHVGKLLAGFDGEHPTVANAIEEHYLPRGSGDMLPQTPEGNALAFIDRLDSLNQCFSLNLQPKGSSDPLGLRRAANGIITLLLNANISLSLSSFIEGDLLKFVTARMTSQFQEDFGGEVTNAVLATGIDCPLSLYGRMNAMQKLSQSPEFSSMRATFKRVMGLTKEHTSTLDGDEQWVDETEQLLCNAYLHISNEVDDHLEARDFDAALNALGQLKEPVDSLFDAVMVMDMDLQVRNNRLSLLKSIANHFRQIADFTILST